VSDLLGLTADYSAQFLGSLDERTVGVSATVEDLRAALGGPLPAHGAGDMEVIANLIAAAEPGVTAIPGGRYFGFVIGGALPAALAADWLTSTWDQNAGLYATGPSAAVVEEVVLEWLRELLLLPAGVSAGFVTGCQMAHMTALAAARHLPRGRREAARPASVPARRPARPRSGRCRCRGSAGLGRW
jgi:glutamate/tyrosine decarboxylase-like PLP-dependent enzyme